MTDADRIARFKHLTEVLLPARAKQDRWPIRLDHCFKRICLDHAFQDVWYHHLSKPAERHITGVALDRALACAEDLLTGDRALLDEHNHSSLRVRGKLRPPHGSEANHGQPRRRKCDASKQTSTAAE